MWEVLYNEARHLRSTASEYAYLKTPTRDLAVYIAEHRVFAADEAPYQRLVNLCDRQLPDDWQNDAWNALIAHELELGRPTSAREAEHARLISNAQAATPLPPGLPHLGLETGLSLGLSAGGIVALATLGRWRPRIAPLPDLGASGLAAFFWARGIWLIVADQDLPLIGSVVGSALGLGAAFAIAPRAFGASPRSRWGSVIGAALAGWTLRAVLDRAVPELPQDWVARLTESIVWSTPLEAAARALTGVLVAPVFEEVVFRGLLYGSLRRYLGVPVASLLSAAFFAWVHHAPPSTFFVHFASGLVLAGLYESTGSLAPGMVLHGTNNFLYYWVQVAVRNGVLAWAMAPY